jgi:ankyrin repeat protein
VNKYINEKRNTLLHVAASDGNLHVIQALIDLGADANAEDVRHYTPAHYATRKNHVICLKRLLNFVRCKRECKRAYPSEPLIITAARNDSEDAALWLLECGESTEVRCKYGITPLHHAALNDSRNVTLLLLRHGADVNSKDNNNLSPLHYAIIKRNTDIGILLSAMKANLHADTKQHMTPLHLAAKDDQLEFLKVLVFHGGNILVPSTNNRRDYPIHVAATYESENVLQWMLDIGVPVNVTNAVGHTPLLNVVRVGNVTMAKVLLDRGADVNIKVTGEDRRTCLHAACLSGSVKMSRLLLEKGADPNASTYTDLRTPLHWAALEGHLKVTKILVKFGANVSARDKFGLRPIKLALVKGHGKIVDFLAGY